jgi:hypothetical protein
MARFRPFNLLATVIAMVAGLVTLLGYFLPIASSGFASEVLNGLQGLRLAFLAVVSLLTGWAVLAGALNLLIVHGRKFVNQRPGWFYSLFVLLGFGVVVLLNILAPYIGWGHGAANAANFWLLTYFIGAGGAALSGLIAFFLVLAAYRLMRTRPGFTTFVFVLTVVVALLALAPWPVGLEGPVTGGETTLRAVLRTLTQLPATAGARGLLLGVALGAIATGLRVLIGLDRPYGD